MSHPAGRLARMLAALGAVQAIAEGQHGTFTSAQAEASGIRSQGLALLARNGVVRQVHRGVWAVRGERAGVDQSYAAACLATGGALMGRTAARYWGLRGARLGRTELLVPYDTVRVVPGLVVHRTRRLVGGDVVERSGAIRVTSVARTLADYAGAVSYERLETAAFDALRRDLTTFADLAAVVARLACRGATGAARLRSFIDRNDALAGLPESELEVRAMRLFRIQGLAGSVQQMGVGPYRLDFAWPASGLAVEVDGRATHTSPADRRYDARRDAFLVDRGWRVRRFTWFDVVYRGAWTVAEIRAELLARRDVRVA